MGRKVDLATFHDVYECGIDGTAQGVHAGTLK